MSRLFDHVQSHPVRLIVTAVVVVLASWTLGAYTLIATLDNQHRTNVAVCRSVNELRRQLYVAAADLGVPITVRARFLPVQDCEDLP